MVIDYLEKVREQYEENQIDLKNKLNAVSNEYKENIELIKVLEDNNDPNFESFTPREVNGFNRQRIAELEERQHQLSGELTALRVHIGAIQEDIYQINSVIKVAKEDVSKESSNYDEKFKFALLETLENERQRIARELHDSTVQNLTSMVHKIELCIKLLDMDPIRCKLELSSMGKVFRDIIEDTRNMIYDLRPMSFDDIGFDVVIITEV